MALSSITRVADGIQSQFSFTFGYLSRSHVFLFVNNTLASYKWIGEFLLEPLVVPRPGDVVTIRRLTDRANRVTTFTDGQTLLAESLNAGDLQVFYIAQEMIDQIEEGIVSGDVSVLNPGTGYITAQWIQDQLTANLAAASQFADIDAAILGEELARAQGLAAEAAARAAAIGAEAIARGAAITAEAATRTAEVLALTTDLEAEATARTADVLSLTAADAATVGRLSIVESDLNTPTTGVKAKLVTVENAVTTETTARASADTAILAEINDPTTGLKARATSLESRTTAVEANKAEASALSALSARVATAEGDIDATEASIVSEATTRATADTAISSSVTALTARVTTAEADINAAEAAIVTTNDAIATETTARASADTAILAEINDPTTGLKARATSLESRTTNVENNKAEASALTALTARVNTAEADINAAEAAITSEASTRATADTAISSSVTALTARVTTAEADINAAEAAIVTTNDAIAAETGARTTQVNALTTRVGAAEAGLVTVNSAVTNLQTGKAEASTVTLLTSNFSGRASGGIINPNPFFDEGPPSSGVIPARWSNWASGFACAVEAKPWGGVGLYARMDPISGTPVNVGWLQDLGQGSIRGGNRYKVRVDLARGTGSLVSSGAYLEFYNASNGFVGNLKLCFGTTADTSGVVSAFGDGRRVWELNVTAPATATKVVLYAMQGWNGFEGAAQASTPQLLWFECSLSNISSDTARIFAAEAAIVSEASTRASADSANATTIENNRAQFASTELYPNLIADDFSQGDHYWKPGWVGWLGGYGQVQGFNLPGWFQPGVMNVAWKTVSMPALGTDSFTDSHNYVPGGSGLNAVPVVPGERLYISALAAGHRLRRVTLHVQYYNSAGTYITDGSLPEATSRSEHPTLIQGGGGGGGLEENFVRLYGYSTVPAGAAFATMFIRMTTHASQADPYLFWARPMICKVPAAHNNIIPWSKQSANVAFLREAIATSNSSTARLLLGVNTATNVATIEAVAQEGSGVWNGAAITLQADLIRLLARNINFGTNTAFEDASGTIYTTHAGRRLRILGPFGSASDLVMWYGPTSVALYSETKTNGYFAFATDGKVYYGNAELGGAGSGAIAKAATGAIPVDNSGAWWGLGAVSFPDVKNPSYIKFPYVDIIGDGPASGSGLSANWFWRIVSYPSGNPGAAVQLASGDMTTAAGGAGEPVSITTLQQPAQRLYSPPHYGNVIYKLEVHRLGGGTGTVPLSGTIYVENIPG